MNTLTRTRERIYVLTSPCGQKISNPKFSRQGERKLAKAQRDLAKLKKGSKERRVKGKAVAKIHEKISNQRKDFCHKESKKIIDQYQYICIEGILDASWNQFCQFLTYKAVEAGRKLGLVNPAYTTQTCSQCGHRERKELSERKHCCVECGYCTGRDHNAAQNILALGIDGLGVIPRSLCL